MYRIKTVETNIPKNCMYEKCGFVGIFLFLFSVLYFP